jgi:hypothetical protein
VLAFGLFVWINRETIKLFFSLLFQDLRGLPYNVLNSWLHSSSLYTPFFSDSLSFPETDSILPVVAFGISIAICCMPPSMLVHDTHAAHFVSLRRHYDEYLLEKAPNNDENSFPIAPFCLELACSLLEASYQSYFKSQNGVSEISSKTADERLPQNDVTLIESEVCEEIKVTTQSESDGPTLDISRVGYSLKSVFSCSQMNTFGYVSETEDEILVSFRGSTMANIATDFMFTQTAMPKLERDYRDFFMLLVQHFKMLVPPDISQINESDQQLLELFGSFHGTEGTKDIVRESMKDMADQIPLLNQSFPRVHVGFWSAYDSIRLKYLHSAAVAIFEKILQRASLVNDDTRSSIEVQDEALSNFDVTSAPIRVLLTGHSLGGALATFAVLDLAINLEKIISISLFLLSLYRIRKTELPSTVEPNSGEPNLNSSNLLLELRRSANHSLLHPKIHFSVYTFGSPRVGNTCFAKLFQSFVKNCFRVIVNGDLVTMVPKIFGFYRHVGVPVILDEDDSTGNILVKPTLLEESFFFRRATGNIANHSLEKYRNCLESCFERKEYNEYITKEYYRIPREHSTAQSQDHSSALPSWAYK